MADAGDRVAGAGAGHGAQATPPRPSAFGSPDYPVLSPYLLVQHYLRDTDAATPSSAEGTHGHGTAGNAGPTAEGTAGTPAAGEWGAALPPPPWPAGGRTGVRVLQWNINSLTGPGWSLRPTPIPHTLVAELILAHNPDVVCLQEFGYAPGQRSRKADQSDRIAGLVSLAKLLEDAGHVVHIAETPWPSMIATRLPLATPKAVTKIQMDEDRGAVGVTVHLHRGGDEALPLTVFSTHLDHRDRSTRRLDEAKTLLKQLHKQGLTSPTSRVIVAGDFNQQRQQDYHGSEWALIQASV